MGFIIARFVFDFNVIICVIICNVGRLEGWKVTQLESQFLIRAGIFDRSYPSMG